MKLGCSVLALLSLILNLCLFGLFMSKARASFQLNIKLLYVTMH
jgi:hypothetical protein